MILCGVGCARERAAPTLETSGSSAALAQSAPPLQPSAGPSPPQAPPAPAYLTPLPKRERGSAAPAKHYANLSRSACAAELKKRALPVKPVRRKTPGLESPLQLDGPLHGVTFKLPRSLYGYLDCRLVLLLDQMAVELSKHAVVAVVVNNAYRPTATIAPTPAATRNPPAGPAPPTKSNGPAKKKTRTTAKKVLPADPMRLSQHALGLAIDITAFRLTDGRVLNVERDWHGALGQPPCHPQSRVEGNEPAGIALRNLTCAIAAVGYCNHLITPNRDEAHANHLHCDIEKGANEITVD